MKDDSDFGAITQLKRNMYIIGKSTSVPLLGVVYLVMGGRGDNSMAHLPNPDKQSPGIKLERHENKIRYQFYHSK